MVKRGEIYWVNLDPTIGIEIRTIDKHRLGAKMGDIALVRCYPALLEMLA
jgi:hypothetical protein